MILLALTVLFVVALCFLWRRAWWLAVSLVVLVLLTGNLLDRGVVWLVNTVNLLVDSVVQ